MSWKEFCKLYDVPKIYQDVNIDQCASIRTKGDINLYEGAMRWITNPVSLILEGEPGRGKTHFMFALVRALIEIQSLPMAAFRIMNAIDIDERVTNEMKSYGSASYFVSTLVDVPLLFIDDWGVEASKERAERNYYHILDKRSNNEMPTIVSTNMKQLEMLDTFGSRIESRLKRHIKLVFNGPDLRQPQGEWIA